MKNHYGLAIAVMLVAALALGAFWFTSGSSAWAGLFTGTGATPAPNIASGSTLEPIRVGYLPIAAQIPFFVGMDRGFFSEEGLDVQAVKFETSNQLMDALVKGDIDAIASAAAPTLYLVNEKAPGAIRSIAMTDDKTLGSLIVKKESPMTRVQELSGKKIASFPGTTAVTVLKEFVEKNGDDLKTVEIVEMAPPLQLSALEAGSVAAVYAYEPNPTIGEAKGVSRVLARNIGAIVSDPLLQGFTGVSAGLVNKRPNAAKAFVRGYLAGARFVAENNTEARKSLSKWTPVGVDVASRVPLSPIYSVAEIQNDPKLSRAAQTLADFLLSKGLLKNPLDVRTLFWSGR